jgi:GNAT superfamily N-acetyltransferase
LVTPKKARRWFGALSNPQTRVLVALEAVLENLTGVPICVREERRMGSVVVRAYRAGDAAAFKALNIAWIEHYFRVEPKDIEALDHPERILADGAIAMAEIDGEPVGACALIKRPEAGVWEIAKMGVTPRHRGAGIGTALMTYLIELAPSLGAKSLYIETNSALTPAIKLYEKFGFRHLGEGEHPPTPYARADVFMARDL